MELQVAKVTLSRGSSTSPRRTADSGIGEEASPRPRRMAGGAPDPNPRHPGQTGQFLPEHPAQWRGGGQIPFCSYTEREGPGGEEEGLHDHLCFCCHWGFPRPSQNHSRTQIKTVVFRKRITCPTTFSSLPFSPSFYWSFPALRLLPSPRLCYLLLTLVWTQIYW